MRADQGGFTGPRKPQRWLTSHSLEAIAVGLIAAIAAHLLLSMSGPDGEVLLASLVPPNGQPAGTWSIVAGNLAALAGALASAGWLLWTTSNGAVLPPLICWMTMTAVFMATDRDSRVVELAAVAPSW